jgi:hypothetical protein
MSPASRRIWVYIPDVYYNNVTPSGLSECYIYNMDMN